MILLRGGEDLTQEQKFVTNQAFLALLYMPEHLLHAKAFRPTFQ
jgi:hypothetical protein